jgi:spermidine synthase
MSINARCLRFTLALLWAVMAGAQAAGPVIHERESKFGTVVVTDEGNNLRALRFGRDGVRQSLVKLDDPEHLGLAYTSVALTGLALCAEPRRFLVIGMGGGSLPRFLRHHYPEATIDAVDINPEVANAAITQLGFREDAAMRIHIADGRKFVENVREPYDAVFLDAYGADSVPPHLTTREFMEAVRRATRSDGVVVGNVWHNSSRPPYAAIVSTYRASFDTFFILRVRGTGNRILLAAPHRNNAEPHELIEKGRQISAQKKFRFDIGQLFESSVMPLWNLPGGKVLTDAAMGL